ncbi:hypothetical protein D7X33_35440 [Butyricicoccus sp. 1XD8-22]|nr:hypothetical protein D7X33_35440 [Butyricicoccus sp. 1XD8-22]
MTLLKMALNMGFGCWYCGGKEGEDLVFSIEFDTPVHKCCAYGALNRNKDDDEAKIFINEFED